jgi:hypothetical protein
LLYYKDFEKKGGENEIFIPVFYLKRSDYYRNAKTIQVPMISSPTAIISSARFTDASCDVFVFRPGQQMLVSSWRFKIIIIAYHLNAPVDFSL